MIETSQRSRITAAIAVLLPLALLAALVVLFYGLRSTGTSSAGNATAEIAALSQSIPLNAAAAARGNIKAFDAVGSGLARLEQLSAAGLPGSAALWERCSATVRPSWQPGRVHQRPNSRKVGQ